MTDQTNNADTVSDLLNEVGDEIGCYASVGATGGDFDSAVMCLDNARVCFRRGWYDDAAERAERALSHLYGSARRSGFGSECTPNDAEARGER